MIRRRVRSRALALTVAKLAELDSERLERPTLVLAPHPDDETLGCGGLVALLRDRGTPVTIAFMTDGAGSHPGFDPAVLRATRRREAIAASAVLGVDAGDLHFLDHPDGGLAEAEQDAARELTSLLAEVAPAQIVMPHPLEPNRDHAATARIAERAVEAAGTPIDALRYFVWFWDQWPWTNPLAPPRDRHGRREIVRTALRGELGLGVGRRLTHKVDIDAVIDRKRAALAEHASQTARPADRPDSITLADVADGDWLDLLLQPHELYSAVTLGGSTTDDAG